MLAMVASGQLLAPVHGLKLSLKLSKMELYEGKAGIIVFNEYLCTNFKKIEASQ